jgi:general secretion pathway protein F
MEYSYKAVTYDGKIQQGRMNGDSEQAVAGKLQAQGLVPVRVLPVDGGAGRRGRKETQTIHETEAGQSVKQHLSKLLSGRVELRFRSKTRTKDLIMFAEQLSLMLRSGITLNKSLSLLGELSENKHFSKVIQEVHGQIREGSSLGEALQAQPNAFPLVFVNMVKAGEAGGVLDSVLKRSAEYLADIQELKEYLLSAMIYPAILGLTAVASIVFMLIFVIPKFSEIFSGMGVELPLITQGMLAIGNFFQAYWWLLLLVLCLTVAAGRYAIQTPRGRKRWDAMKLRTPVLGSIFQKIEIARFSRTMGTLLDSGVSILSALHIVNGVVLNSVLRDSLNNVYDDLKQGRMLSVALEKRHVFPQLAINMLGVGEESGSLTPMLDKVGEIYDKELKTAIKSFTSMFEPCLILFMGLIIGIMVVSMLLAIFSINQMGV